MPELIFRVIYAEIHRHSTVKALQPRRCAPTGAPGPRQRLRPQPAARGAGFQGAERKSLLSSAGSFGEGNRKGNAGFVLRRKSSGKWRRSPLQKCPQKGEEQHKRGLKRTCLAVSPGTPGRLAAAPPPPLRPVIGGPGALGLPGPGGAPRRAPLPSTARSRSRRGGIAEQM